MEFKRELLKASLIGAFGALALGTSVAAHATLANGIVDTWTVDVSAVFDTTTICDSTGDCTSPTGVTVVNNQSLRWGSGDSGPSGLDITNSPSTTQVNTNGAAVANVGVTHLNRPITGTTLASADIVSTLTLTPFAPPGSGLPSQSITFHIDFLETPNGDNPCANGDANGSGVNSAGCADIFVIDQSALNFAFPYDLGMGPRQYFISFFEQTNGLNPLPAAACGAVLGNNPPPCIGFQTPEGVDTSVRFAALITTQPVSLVPEPATLALLATGLIGMGWTRRRRQH